MKSPKLNQFKKMVIFCLDVKSTEFLEENYPENINLRNLDFFEKGENPKVYNLKLNNSKLGSVLLEIAEEKLNKRLPLSIDKALIFVQDFENELKQPQLNVSWAGLGDLKECLIVHILIKFQNELNIDVIQFFKDLLDNSSKKEYHFILFDRYFFKALAHFNIDLPKIIELIDFCNSKEKTNHQIIRFCQELSKNKRELSNELFDEIIKNDNYELGIIPSHLLIGLYDQDATYVFEKAMALFSSNPMLTIFFLGRIDFKELNHVNQAINIINQIPNDNKVLINNSIDIYFNILKCKHLTDDIKNDCFLKLEALLEVNNETINNTLINFLSYWLEGFENERNHLLYLLIDKVENKEFIKYYFTNFKDPNYFFHFFERFYHSSNGRIKMEYFDHSLGQFWRSHHEQTENYLLTYLSHESIFWRKAGISLLKTAHASIYTIDCLKLDTELKQLRCLEGLVKHPFSIELMLPMILNFRNSTYSKVKKEVQNSLSILVFKSYREALYDLIVKSIGTSQKDKNFLKPIEKALKAYNDLKELKNSIKDLDPRENERNFIDLYYRLEHENQAKMMESIKNGAGFLSSFFGKSSVIVRGHSWKLDGDTEVRPLGKIEHSTLISADVSKNPDLFQFNLNNLNSKY